MLMKSGSEDAGEEGGGAGLSRKRRQVGKTAWMVLRIRRVEGRERSPA
jgi:hypothetical protein